MTVWLMLCRPPFGCTHRGCAVGGASADWTVCAAPRTDARVTEVARDPVTPAPSLEPRRSCSVAAALSQTVTNPHARPISCL